MYTTKKEDKEKQNENREAFISFLNAKISAFYRHNNNVMTRKRSMWKRMLAYADYRESNGLNNGR